MKPLADRRLLSFFLALAVTTAGGGIRAAAYGETAQTVQALSAHAILQRMADRNPALRSYRARVHVNIRMLSFPFFAPRLDGTSYFKRPDFYVVVFDRMPNYARGFQRIFDDVGSPSAWEKDQNVSLDGTAWVGNRSTIVLRLTKKIHSDILDHTLAYVDPNDFSLVQMEWYYTNGGKITMTQQYRFENGYSLLSQQHATIKIPYVRAIADSTYGTYQTNVPVGDGSPAP
jgi:outer membrane lipoprotein-sorting protein